MENWGLFTYRLYISHKPFIKITMSLKNYDLIGVKGRRIYLLMTQDLPRRLKKEWQL